MLKEFKDFALKGNVVDLAIGVVIGGVAVWLNQGRHRRSERRLRAETERLLGEREASAERDREARRAALALSGPGRRAA